MKNSVSLAVLSLASLLTVSCSKEASKKEQALTSIQVNALISAGKTNEAATLLSIMGERILLNNPENILAADALFNQALDLNKAEPKANLYTSLTGLTKVTKGFAVRFNSLLTAQQKSELKRIENAMSDKGLYELVDFAQKLPDGKQNVKNYNDAKIFLKKELLQELKNSSAKIALINEQKFELNIPRTQSTSACVQIEDGWSCETERAKVINQVAFDQYDAKALRSIFKVYETQLTLALLFNTDDLQVAADEIQQKKQVSDKEAVEVIKKYPSLLKIDSKDELKAVFQNTESILNDFMDFTAMRDTLCNEQVRDNHLSGPICIDEKQSEKLKTAVTLVAGPSEIYVGQDKDGNDVELLVNLRAWEDSSFKGLQSLLPGQFDENGKAKDIKDKTFGGLFPNGDFLEKMESVKKVNESEVITEISEEE